MCQIFQGKRSRHYLQKLAHVSIILIIIAQALARQVLLQALQALPQVAQVALQALPQVAQVALPQALPQALQMVIHVIIRLECGITVKRKPGYL